MDKWVVWSEEHGGWWMPGSLGYTQSLRLAGRYTEERAKLIEDTANRFLPKGVINEFAMPDPMPGEHVAKPSS
jgi:hypothetical protein